jgi:uncharacterized protein (TIGR02147 family)
MESTNQPDGQKADSQTPVAPAAVAQSPQANSLKQSMPDIVEAPEIGNYLDYRMYLADYYKFRRTISAKDIRPYSYAVFSASADIKSPNYLKMIIEGKRNLSDDMITKFARAMALNKDLTEEFRLLVNFSQSSDPGERNMYMKALNEYRVAAKLKRGEIDKKAFEKIPNWITWILYAMIDQADVKFTAERIHELLRGKARFEDIEAAIAKLLESGEITIDANGVAKKSRTLMDSAEDVPVALVRKLQTELIYLGLESLFRDSPVDREFGTATLSLTKAEFEDLRFNLRKFRKDVQKNISTARSSGPGERVYQLNMQLFPVTDKAD